MSGKTEKLINELTQWINNTWADPNVRTPQIRDLNRALLNALLTAKLIDREEFADLNRGM
jgi:hypothetical protein